MTFYFFKESKYKYYKEILLNYLVVSFIFLFDLKYEFFQFRYFILILLVPCIYYIRLDIKNKNFNFIISFLFITLFLFFLTSLNLFLEKEKFSEYYLYSIFYLIFIFTISYYFRKFINQNIYLITKFFVIIFLISSILSFISFVPDTPYFCGGIPDIFNLTENIAPQEKYIRLSFKEFIFLENSHLGMIAPSILLLGLYKIFSTNSNYFDKSIFLIFFLLCLIKSSTTFYLGLLVSSIFLFSFNFRNFSISIKILFSILIIFSSLILIFNDECRMRFSPYKSNIQDKLNKQVNLNLAIDNSDLQNQNHHSVIKKILKIDGSLSSGVYYHAINIAKQALFLKPFGWGLNRYESAFDHFTQINPSNIKILNFMNKKDGSNNLIKIFVEFGVFGVLFYLIIFLFLIEKKVPLELKIFYLPFIITQSIRGAGYFNGGFALIVFLIIINYISFRKK